MHILFVYNSLLPAKTYGGIERSIWYLGKDLVRLGHKVTYLAKQGSVCPFGEVVVMNASLSISEQVPDNIDILHVCQLEKVPPETFSIPFSVFRNILRR